MLDYLVVGLGLGGVSFSETLLKNNKTFHVISDDSQVSSKVAGGMYNPVILKRFTLAWNADKQLQKALPFYKKLEEKLETKLDCKIPILRKFASIEEQNMWFEAADKPVLEHYMSTTVRKNSNPEIDAPFGFGEVLNTGRIDTSLLLEKYSTFLQEQLLLTAESLDYDELQINQDYIQYRSIKAKQIVFAEGYGLIQNPFFNYLPLNGTKGELLRIKSTDFKETSIIKSGVFTVPLDNDEYLVGATYKWKDKTNTPTTEAREELEQKLKTFLKCPYNVVKHVAGIRPTVADRRPLLGRHPVYENVYVLNGFGSRGVIIGPTASEQLYDFIEHQKQLPVEIDISRFTKKYFKS